MAQKNKMNELFGTLMYAVVLSAVLGTIAGSFVTLQADTTNFTAGQIVLIGLCITIIVIGVVYQLAKAHGLAN